jgi:hypothetical protein
VSASFEGTDLVFILQGVRYDCTLYLGSVNRGKSTDLVFFTQVFATCCV